MKQYKSKELFLFSPFFFSSLITKQNILYSFGFKKLKRFSFLPVFIYLQQSHLSPSLLKCLSTPLPPLSTAILLFTLIHLLWKKALKSSKKRASAKCLRASLQSLLVSSRPSRVGCTDKALWDLLATCNLTWLILIL